MTHVEAEGEICNRYEYDAWGNLTTCEEQIENHFRFAGQQLDPSGNSCDNAADRICNLIDERRIRGNNRSSLENYLKEKAGNLTDAESQVAKKLGLEVETGGKSGGKSETSYGKSSGNYSGADNIADAARLKEYYKQAEKYGTGSIKELSNGRFRFYEELKLARTKGEMAGARHVREWDSYTGYKRDWYETLDHNGNIRQVRPDPNITGGVKVHYMFDVDGNYIGNWVPNK